MTVTLPERTLSLLESLDADRAVAIAKAVDMAAGVAEHDRDPIRMVKVDEHTSLMVVGPSKCLRKIPWLNLAEIAPAQFIIVIPTGTAPERLELEIMDIVSKLPPEETYERTLLEALRGRIRAMRHGKGLATSEIVLLRS